MLSWLLLTILTCIVYLLANGFTYHIGTSKPCGKPLQDVMHTLLPDLSHWVHIRDIVFTFFFIPIIYIHNKLAFFYDVWDNFMIIVLIKAVCIFFTFIPPSNPLCEEKKYLNHCFHSSTSGHASLCLLLFLMYIKHGVFTNYQLQVYTIVFLYCLLILMTRAHYTVDILQAIIVTTLITC
jgi:hypothetical protein